VFREAGMQVPPVIMSCPSLSPVCCHKRPLKEEEGLLTFLAFVFWDFTLGFLVWEAFGRKRIIEGKMLKRG
jgi:hypothetical protein